MPGIVQVHNMPEQIKFVVSSKQTKLEFASKGFNVLFYNNVFNVPFSSSSSISSLMLVSRSIHVLQPATLNKKFTSFQLKLAEYDTPIGIPVEIVVYLKLTFHHLHIRLCKVVMQSKFVCLSLDCMQTSIRVHSRC